MSMKPMEQLPLDGGTFAKSDMTVAQFREALSAGRMALMGTSGTQPAAEDQKQLSALRHECQSAVRIGRMFDFGHVPNRVIQSEGKRAAALLMAGHIKLPFDSFLLRHTWEEGACFYLVARSPNDENTILVAELQPAALGNQGDFIVSTHLGSFTPTPDQKYAASIVPAAAVLNAASARGMDQTQTYEIIASALIDPVVACLGILHTDNVPVTSIVPSAKLQRARQRSGKHPLPSHIEVDTRDYITAILNRGTSRHGASGGGTHASPVAHVRRGHPRTYESGVTVWIRDTLVNFRESDEVAKRTAYVLKGAGRNE